MEIRKVKVSDIIVAPYNPRVALKAGDPDYEKIKRSLEEFGLVEPLVFNEHNGVLVGGHQRLQVMMDSGAQEVEVSVVNIKDENREKALNIALNKIAGRWDMDKMHDIMADMREHDFDLSLTGFDMLESENILAHDDGGTGGPAPLDAHLTYMLVFDTQAQYDEFMDIIGKLRDKPGDTIVDKLINTLK